MKEHVFLITAIVVIAVILLVSFEASGTDEQKMSSGGEKKVSEAAGRLRYFITSVIGGLVVLGGQIFFNPITAMRVKVQESIAAKRYEVCDRVVNIFQRRLASVPLKGPDVPSDYKPTETSPSQLEVNETYTLLSLYCTDASIANKFKDVVMTKGISQQDVAHFILTLRSEMGVKSPGLDPKDFRYIYCWQKEKLPKEGDEFGGTINL